MIVFPPRDQILPLIGDTLVAGVFFLTLLPWIVTVRLARFSR